MVGVDGEWKVVMEGVRWRAGGGVDGKWLPGGGG